jgi:hypothetical protein
MEKMMPQCTEGPTASNLFDQHGNLIEVHGGYCTIDEALKAYAAMLKKPRRANEVVLICWKGQTLKRSDKVD